MGIIELAAIFLAAVISSGVVLVTNRVMPRVEVEPRPRLSVPPFLAFILWLVVSMVVSRFVPTAPLVEALLGEFPLPVVLLSSDGKRMQEHVSDFYFYGLATPATGALAWWLLTRSPRVAAVSFVAGVVGFVASAYAVFSTVQPIMNEVVDSVDGGGIEPMVGACSAVKAGVQLMFGVGFGATAMVGVGVVAASSRSGLRFAILATFGSPVVMLVAAGIATPPDVISQLVFAVMLVAAWVLGLGSGAVVGWIYRRRRAA